MVTISIGDGGANAYFLYIRVGEFSLPNMMHIFLPAGLLAVMFITFY
ncbi:hypothetical protein P343_07775 [Sporolactobacillus laevolacticus DSM 442]|uniref:Uncharacterized protein n=1 Tax=Sporolactobacillus laevolacticus DSM 442 TaxID=1395513 RepID=V6J616_9BACL|nr:hypothetical protein P343_07775 [Sporolactobacillus laevolacticus DSM 442]